MMLNAVRQMLNALAYLFDIGFHPIHLLALRQLTRDAAVAAALDVEAADNATQLTPPANHRPMPAMKKAIIVVLSAMLRNRGLSSNATKYILSDAVLIRNNHQNGDFQMSRNLSHNDGGVAVATVAALEAPRQPPHRICDS